jgi:hypothetical protein
MAVKTLHEFNCLLLRDGTSYLTLTHIPPSTSALILHDRQGTGGSGISAGTFSRKRWRALKDEEERARLAAVAEREREQTRKAKAEREAKAKAQAERKVKLAAQQAVLEAHGRALHEFYSAQAAHATQATAAALEQARQQAIAAHAAAQQHQAHAAAQQADEAAVQRLIDEEHEHVRQLLTRLGLGSLLTK